MHQGMKVNPCRAGQSLKVIAAFQDRNNAAACVAIGQFHQPQRGPGEILFREFEASQRVAHMGVEARRDDDQIRRK